MGIRSPDCFSSGVVHTTGLQEPAAVSLAIQRQVDGEIVFSKYYLINPEKPIDFRAYQVHGISQTEVQNKPNFAQLWPEIKEYIEGQTVVDHNVRFDAEQVLMKQLVRYNLPYKPFTTICTCNNAKKLIEKSKIGNYKLDTLCDYLNIDFTDHHNALADTNACREIFNELIKLGKLESKEIL